MSLTHSSVNHKDTNSAHLCRFPLNYTLLYIPASSSHFGGYHWIIYDEAKSFYSYDDGDSTPGEDLEPTAKLCLNLLGDCHKSAYAAGVNLLPKPVNRHMHGGHADSC